MPPTQRDLASHELWHRSLERSRHRRELAPIVRKTASRRKRLSLAVSAAVATAPTAPSLAAGESSGPNGQATNVHSLLSRHQDPVLLHIGVTSPAVKQLQRALHITVDGIFGPQTQGAVRTYQVLHNLPPTGNVDVKTWLTLFPNDTVIATPAGWSATTGGGGPAAATDAASVSSAGATTQPVSDVTAAGAPGAGAAAAGGAQAGAQGGGTVHAAAAATHGPQASAAAATGTSASTAANGGGVPAGTFSSAAAPVSGGGTSGFSGGGGGFAQTPGGPTPQVTAHPGGTAAQLIDKMIAAANRITARHYAYSWGGGHNPQFSGPYDCSGAVSAVLHAAGLLSSPMVSGDFVHWGAPGPGAVTIYANATHVYMSILGHFFGTSGSNPGGGAAWFNGAPRPGFAVVHVPFERMHLRQSPTVRKASRAKVRVRVRQASHAPTTGHTYASDGGTPAPSSQPASQASDQQPTYDPPPPPPSSAPASSSASASSSSQTSSSESSSAAAPSSESSVAAPSSASSSGAASSGSESSSTVAPSETSSSAVPARTMSSTPESSGSGAGTTASSESTAAPSSHVSHVSSVEAPVTQTAPSSSGTAESSGSGVSGPSQSSHVAVSTDSGSGSSSSASSSNSGSSGSSSSGSSSTAGSSHASGSGSGSSVVKASDG